MSNTILLHFTVHLAVDDVGNILHGGRDDETVNSLVFEICCTGFFLSLLHGI